MASSPHNRKSCWIGCFTAGSGEAETLGISAYSRQPPRLLPKGLVILLMGHHLLSLGIPYCGELAGPF